MSRTATLSRSTDVDDDDALYLTAPQTDRSAWLDSRPPFMAAVAWDDLDD